MLKRLLITITCLAVVFSGSAAAATDNMVINSLTANYYLDRNAEGISTLVVEETFDVSFPNGGTGFTRKIPAQYLSNSNNLKVTEVTEVSGTAIPFKLSKDSENNQVINIGNPSITVFGSRSYIIRYQAQGVINILEDRQEFYPNFNGRGWDIGFGSINAVIHVSKAIAGDLVGGECLIDSGKCTVTEDKKDTETLIKVSSAGSVPAHQSLTAKLNFKPGTFKPYNQNLWGERGKTAAIVLLGVLALLSLAAFGRETAKRIKSRQKSKSH